MRSRNSDTKRAVLHGDGGVVRQELGLFQVVGREGAPLQAVVHVEQAFDLTLAADGNAHHRAQLEVFDARHVGETLVATGIDRQERTPAVQHTLGNPGGHE